MTQRLNLGKVKELRELAGLTYAQAAELGGLPGGGSYWWDVESGRRKNVTIETLSRLAKALKCDARDLLTDPKARK